MTWTYDGTPGTDTANGRRDAVRMLIGDTDTNDQQIQDGEIEFALLEAGDDVYTAGAICAQAIASRYARDGDVKFDDVSEDMSTVYDQYQRLATRLSSMSKRHGKNGLGIPRAGGISVSAVRTVEQDTDRVDPKVKQDAFANPSGGTSWPSAT